MKIALITPAKKSIRSGNRTSATRWARLLGGVGHRVQVSSEFNAARRDSVDLMIALHAYRSAPAIARYRRADPHGPLIVVLGGTDINTYLTSHPEKTLPSMDSANALVGLHELVADQLPDSMHAKLQVIRQSAQPLGKPATQRKRTFDVCVVGLLRDEKDPLRAATAARLLPASSRLRLTHLGSAADRSWEDRARKEMADNPRYVWRGEVPPWQVRREFARTRAMIISSNQEGGANVVGEAVVAGVPVIATDISGNRGLLGEDYRGYYPVGEERALSELLARAENEPAFLQTLARQCAKLAPLFSPEREAAAWAKLVAELTS